LPTTSPAPNWSGDRRRPQSRLHHQGQQLTRVPKRLPKDHPRGEWLRYKTLTAHRDFGCQPGCPPKRAKTEVAKSCAT